MLLPAPPAPQQHMETDRCFISHTHAHAQAHTHTLETELRYKDIYNQSQSETHRQPLPLEFMTSTEMDVSTVLCESAAVHCWLELEKSVQVNVASHRSGA